MMLHWVSSYGLIFPKENQQGSTDSISMNSAQDHPDIDLKKKITLLTQLEVVINFPVILKWTAPIWAIELV